MQCSVITQGSDKSQFTFIPNVVISTTLLFKCAQHPPSPSACQVVCCRFSDHDAVVKVLTGIHQGRKNGRRNLPSDSTAAFWPEVENRPSTLRGPNGHEAVRYDELLEPYRLYFGNRSSDSTGIIGLPDATGARNPRDRVLTSTATPAPQGLESIMHLREYVMLGALILSVLRCVPAVLGPRGVSCGGLRF